MDVRTSNNKFNAVVLAVTTMTITLFQTTGAYPDGPPVSQCADMTPNHGGGAQTSSPPYTITTSATCYTPAQAVTGNT